ncbi:unnamed protein product [Oikopleura dioica]|uniref:Secreted protein n=1 Tax=Oikopleura dioica TaxID=34765 RepID=E4Y9C8_OIKDI|nr:unnamed protein product [Oikopleura dioica]
MRAFFFVNSFLPTCLSIYWRAVLPTHWPEDHTGSTWYPGIMCERQGICDDYSDQYVAYAEVLDVVSPEANEED